MGFRHVFAILLFAIPVQLVGAELTRAERKIAAAVDSRSEAAIALLGKAVDIRSATENHAGVRKTGELFAEELRAIGFETKWVDLPAEMNRAGHLVAEHKGTKGKRVLLIGHLDTVLEGEPFNLDGNHAYGNGTSDMKGGDVIIVEALRALHASGALDDRRIIVVMTGDEENPGLPQTTSRAALVEAAERSDLALAFEAYVPGGASTGRRGIAHWRVDVTGAQGHSALIFGKERGDGAIFEASRIIAAFHDELREPYLTYSPSLFLGGTDVMLARGSNSGTASGKFNVVAKNATVQGDLRFLTLEQLDRVKSKMWNIVVKSLPRTEASIDIEMVMPPMAPTDGNRALLGVLDKVSRDLGTGPIAENDPNRTGAADISFIAHLVDALDGLGALGEQEHAPGEHVDLSEMPNLTKRAALLIYRLTR